MKKKNEHHRDRFLSRSKTKPVLKNSKSYFKENIFRRTCIKRVFIINSEITHSLGIGTWI